MTVCHNLARGRTALLAVGLAAAWLPAAHAQQLYGSSVVGTEFDCVRDDDPSTFRCLHAVGRGLREMPDKTRERPLQQEAFAFRAHFDDGTSVDLAVDVGFETQAAARAEAMRYTTRLGKLPTALRRGVSRIVVHAGGEDATAFSDIGLIVIYAANATRRIGTHDLEETLFHESVHAAWDREHAQSAAWRAAQTSDGGFVTRYASRHPDREDLAESALLAYTLLHHPERLPAADQAGIAAAIPARVAFVKALLPPGEPIFVTVAPPHACRGAETPSPGAGATESRPESAPESEVQAPDGCGVNLNNPGELEDVLSNALILGLRRTEPVVQAFLEGARGRCASSEDLLAAAAFEFGLDRTNLDTHVEAFRHCNCTHPTEVEASQPR